MVPVPPDAFSVQLDIQFHGGAGPSFNNISWGTYIGMRSKVHPCLHLLHESHPVLVSCGPERIHRACRAPVFP